MLPPEKATFKSTSLPAVSPDGRGSPSSRRLGGKDQLWVRDLDSLAARALTGTDGANDPFWSPDSRSIAFFADGKLKKIEVAGGPALTLCDAAGRTWGVVEQKRRDYVWRQHRAVRSAFPRRVEVRLR